MLIETGKGCPPRRTLGGGAAPENPAGGTRSHSAGAAQGRPPCPCAAFAYPEAESFAWSTHGDTSRGQCGSCWWGPGPAPEVSVHIMRPSRGHGVRQASLGHHDRPAGAPRSTVLSGTSRLLTGRSVAPIHCEIVQVRSRPGIPAWPGACRRSCCEPLPGTNAATPWPSPRGLSTVVISSGRSTTVERASPPPSMGDGGKNAPPRFATPGAWFWRTPPCHPRTTQASQPCA
jgi:hypothetical protein